MLTFPPSGVYLIALSSRFTTTCLSRDGSACISTGSLPSDVSEMRFSSASSFIWSVVVRASSAKSKRTGCTRASPASNREIARRLATIFDNRCVSSKALPIVSLTSSGKPCPFCEIARCDLGSLLANLIDRVQRAPHEKVTTPDRQCDNQWEAQGKRQQQPPKHGFNLVVWCCNFDEKLGAVPSPIGQA